MSLTDWQRNGWLTPHQASREEITGLLALIDRDLKDCTAEGLSADWRFNIAYNAALQSAAAALHASGYRAARDSAHYRTIHSLSHTVGAKPETVRALDLCRRKRNRVEYENTDLISETEAQDMAEMAHELSAEVKFWLSRHHPKLLNKPLSG